MTCSQLVAYYLDRIESENNHLNVFLEVFDESALKRAEAIDLKIKGGSAGKLAGFVIGIKDLFCYQDHKMTCSSRILENFESQITATCVQRLLDEDAIIIGRQNCDEFAMGSSNESSAYGATLNPLNSAKVPGGSSGGSAAAVAADMCLASIGSDTGGSIRQPAAFCGIVGFKPSYSRISRYGLSAYASSFDTVGTLTKSVEDAALLTEVMAGPDQNDSTSFSEPAPKFTQSLGTTTSELKIAVIPEMMNSEVLESDLKEDFEEVIGIASETGHKFFETEFPFLEYLLPTYYILTSAEASTNLSRYDGVRYGLRTSEDENLEMLYKKTRTEGFGDEVLRRILLGTQVLTSSYQEAYYKKAQKVREKVKQYTAKILENYDFIMTPTTPTTAFDLGEKSQDPLEMYLSDILTVQASIAGFPSISIPYQKRSKMPTGIQIMGRNFEEEKLLKFANSLSLDIAN